MVTHLLKIKASIAVVGSPANLIKFIGIPS